EILMSTTVRELIESPDFGQGMPAGRKVKAVIPGGSSAPVLAADEIDVALEFEALKAVQNMAGSGGVIVMDDATARCASRGGGCAGAGPPRAARPRGGCPAPPGGGGGGGGGRGPWSRCPPGPRAPPRPRRWASGRPSARSGTPRRSRCTASS